MKQKYFILWSFILIVPVVCLSQETLPPGGLFDGTDASINSFDPQQVSFNTGAPYNGAPAIVDGNNNVTTPLFISDRWLYTYSPSASGYSGWDKINKDSQIAPGIGFIMKGTGASNQNYVFKGLPNDGKYAFPIQAGESMVIGNPYPSAIDSEKFITDNLGVINEIQFWVDGGSNSHYLSNYLGGYAIWNKTAGAPPSVIASIAELGSASGLIPKDYMAVGQGFFVEAISDGPIIFKNSQRILQKEDNANSIFYKTSNTKGRAASEVDEPKRFIRIGYEDPEMFHRQIVLGFLPNSPASLDFNMGYDAIMFDPRDDEMFYIIENDLTRKYVIQGVGTYDVSYEFPIGLKISEEGTHTIMLDDIENFEDVIYIKDKLLNTRYNLSKSNFSLNLPPGDYLDRFSIVFDNATSKSTLDNTDVFAENNLRVYYLNNKIVINNTNNLELSDVAIFNIVGQKIIELNKNDLKQQKITIPFM